MRLRKNKKRIDPRYFLHETREDDWYSEEHETLADRKFADNTDVTGDDVTNLDDVEAVVNAAVDDEGGAYKAPRDFGRKPVPYHQGHSMHARNAPTPEERQKGLAQIQTSFNDAARQVKNLNIGDVESMEAARATLERIGRMIYDIQGHLDQSTYFQDDLDFAREPDPYGDE